MAYEIVYSEEPTSRGHHIHAYYEVLYVAEGDVQLTIRGRQYRAGPGTLAFLGQYDEHATRLLSEIYRRYYLLIPPKQLQAFHQDVRLLSVFRFHGCRAGQVLDTGMEKDRFDRYFAMLLDAGKHGGDYADERVEALMTLLLADTCWLCPDMFLPAEDISALPIQEILGELDSGVCHYPSVQALADHYHVSVGCLSEHFKRMVGVSPKQYALQSRLQRARVLLLQTELSVSDVACQCGWRDTSNFVRRFRQEYGMTPLSLRHEHHADQTRHREERRPHASDRERRGAAD